MPEPPRDPKNHFYRITQLRMSHAARWLSPDGVEFFSKCDLVLSRFLELPFEHSGAEAFAGIRPISVDLPHKWYVWVRSVSGGKSVEIRSPWGDSEYTSPVFGTGFECRLHSDMPWQYLAPRQSDLDAMVRYAISLWSGTDVSKGLGAQVSLPVDSDCSGAADTDWKAVLRDHADYGLLVPGTRADRSLASSYLEGEFRSFLGTHPNRDDRWTTFREQVLSEVFSIFHHRLEGFIAGIPEDPYAAVKRLSEYFRSVRSFSLIPDAGGGFDMALSRALQKHSRLSPGIAIMPLASAKSGAGYLFFSEKGIAESCMGSVLAELKKDFPRADIPYANYRDAMVGGSSFCVEQFVSRGIFRKDLYKNPILAFDPVGNARIASYESVVASDGDGILLDWIGKKVYFRGERLSSKEIPSQQATVEILGKLIRHRGKGLSNREFSVSSYSKNRNEMVSKILIPIKRFIESRNLGSFAVRCNGQLQEFVLTLDECDVPIRYIEKGDFTKDFHGNETWFF